MLHVSRSQFISLFLRLTGCLVVIVAAVMSSASGISQAVIMAGAILPIAGFLYERRTDGARKFGLGVTRSLPPEESVSPVDDREAFDAWREQVCQSLEEQNRQVDQKRQQLHDRMLRYHEFLEYPADEPAENPSEDSESQLSERDREVNRLLEQEAARVYEKLRADGYRVDGQLDSATIRLEVFDVIQRVAQVYSPDSANPVMETSFDQLARAASRLCLQALVLVEQLPLEVQHYTIAELYNYVRKAVMAWGTWQAVSPWMTRLGRGMYAGRLVAGSNPVTLGAWWMASELGRRGTKKLVENYVDQRAVSFFNDAVRLVGNEVACVYGPGVRQRDAAWAYGAELTELHYRFPSSRDSLQASLREVTGLPLRSEYDRIYLYRCLAEHKPSGLRLADPTVLTREERGNIADRLGQFFQDHIHGTREADVARWQDSVEEHLDLRLSLNSDPSAAKQRTSPREALRSIYSFLTGAGGLDPSEALKTLQSSQLCGRLNSSEFQTLKDELAASGVLPFEPPGLDPADPLTSDFLDALIACCVRAPLFDPSLDALLLETGQYFRRSAEETRRAITDAWMQRLRTRTMPNAPMPRQANVPARQLLQLLEPDESIVGVYHEIQLDPTSLCHDLTATDLRLVVLRQSGRRRLVLLTDSGESEVIWQSVDDFTVERVGGLVMDDCIVTGGQWGDNENTGRIILSGRFGTKYETWFAPLLACDD